MIVLLEVTIVFSMVLSVQRFNVSGVDPGGGGVGVLGVRPPPPLGDP